MSLQSDHRLPKGNSLEYKISYVFKDLVLTDKRFRKFTFLKILIFIRDGLTASYQMCLIQKHINIKLNSPPYHRINTAN